MKRMRYKVLFILLFYIILFGKLNAAGEVIELETEKSTINLETEEINTEGNVTVKYGDFTINDIFDTFSKFYPYSYISTSPSLAIYSKYPISDGQSIPFKQSNNGAVWADIDVKGMKVRVISVHMQTTSFDRLRSKMAKAEEANNSDEKQNILEQYYSNSLNNNIRKRANQAKQIAELVNTTNTPVLLCGDFNDIPNSYTYNTLKGYLKDGFKSAGKGFAHTYKGLYNIMRIDYIFYGDAFSPIRYETIPFDMSDHNPVLMEVGF